MRDMTQHLILHHDVISNVQFTRHPKLRTKDHFISDHVAREILGNTMTDGKQQSLESPQDMIAVILKLHTMVKV